MEKYTIAENFRLPSEGKIYKQQVSPDIKLASMTTYHEMQRLNHSDLQYKNMCDIIDDCMVEGPGISSYDLCLGDYLFLLHRLRVVTYGNEYSMVASCPFCGADHALTINLDELKIRRYDEELEKEIAKYQEFELPISKQVVSLRFQTPHMLDRIKTQAEEYKEKAGLEFNVDLMYMIKESIELLDGEKPNPLKILEWVKNLPMQDTNMILAAIAKLNGLIGIDLVVPVQCDVCGLPYNSAFRMNAEFFRPAPDFGR